MIASGRVTDAEGVIDIAPYGIAPLPPWGTSFKHVVLSAWRLFRLLAIDLLVIQIATGCYLIYELLHEGGLPDFNPYIFTSITFVIAFLLSTRMSFSLDRYRHGVQSFIEMGFATQAPPRPPRAAPGLHGGAEGAGLHAQTLAGNLAGLTERSTAQGGSLQHLPLANHPHGTPTAEEIVDDLGHLLRILPHAALERFTGDGSVDYSALGAPVALCEELAAFRFEPIAAFNVAIQRRLALLLRFGLYPASAANALHNLVFQIFAHLGRIAAVRRCPAPGVFRDYLYVCSFLYLLFFPLAMWPSWGYLTFGASFVYSYLVLGVVVVAERVKEPYESVEEQPFVRVDLRRLAMRLSVVIDELLGGLLHEMRGCKEAAPALADDAGLPAAAFHEHAAPPVHAPPAAAAPAPMPAAAAARLPSPGPGGPGMHIPPGISSPPPRPESPPRELPPRPRPPHARGRRGSLPAVVPGPYAGAGGVPEPPKPRRPRPHRDGSAAAAPRAHSRQRGQRGSAASSASIPGAPLDHELGLSPLRPNSA
eukprot:tig00000498_g1648.t1